MITTINKLRLIYFFIFLILLTKNLIANDQKMQKISNFSIDIFETSVEQFSIFTKTTGYITEAEKRGWGFVFENGWVKKTDWNWKYPYGLKAEGTEPAVHINYDEAAMYCEWNKKRIPTEEEWD